MSRTYKIAINIILFLILFLGRFTCDRILLSFPIIQLGVVILLFGYILISLHFKTFFIPKESLNFIILNSLFILFSSITYIYTDAKIYGLEKLLLLLYVLFIFIWILIVNYNYWALFYDFCLMTIVLMFLPAIYYLYLSIATLESGARLGLGGSGSITIGRIFAFSALSSTYFYLKGITIKIAFNLKYKKIFLISCIVFLLSTLMSGSRGDFIGVILSIIILLLCYKKINVKKIFLIFSFLIILFATIFEIENIPFYYRYKVVFSAGKGNESVLERINLINYSADMFLNSNFLGYGIGSFATKYHHVDQINYPHNIFLEIMSELGIIPLIIFLVLILYSLKLMISKKMYLILSIWIFYLISAQLSGDLFDSRMVFLLIAFTYIKNKDL